jgi:hypothetical protein
MWLALVPPPLKLPLLIPMEEGVGSGSPRRAPTTHFLRQNSTRYLNANLRYLLHFWFIRKLNCKRWRYAMLVVAVIEVDCQLFGVRVETVCLLLMM